MVTQPKTIFSSQLMGTFSKQALNPLDHCTQDSACEREITHMPAHRGSCGFHLFALALPFGSLALPFGSLAIPFCLRLPLRRRAGVRFLGGTGGRARRGARFRTAGARGRASTRSARAFGVAVRVAAREAAGGISVRVNSHDLLALPPVLLILLILLVLLVVAGP